MFSRLKGALGPTEDQARQRASIERGSSSNSPATTRNNTGSPSKQADPSVFEAAFKLDDDDSDTIGRSPTPQPQSPENSSRPNVKAPESGEEAPSQGQGQGPQQNANTDKMANADVPQKPTEPTAGPSNSQGLPPQVAAKLKKMDKLEATYKELLRSYRIAHARATSIEPFERALREITPLNSIAEPGALVEYIGQLSLKSNMYMDELKSITAEKEEFKKKFEEVAKELATLRYELKTPSTSEDKVAYQPDKPNADSVHDKGDGGEDFFSYDDSMNEQITTLNQEIAALKAELEQTKDKQVVQGPTQLELDARIAEIDSLTKELERNQQQVQGLESVKAKLTASYKSALNSVKQHHDEEKKLLDQNKQMAETITSLNGQIETYKNARPESSRAQSKPGTPISNKKRKNLNKKKGGNSRAPSETSEMSAQIDSDDEAVTAGISKLQDQLTQKESSIAQLSQQIKTMGDSLAEYVNLDERLSDTLRANEELKTSITKLEGDNTALENTIREVDIAAAKANGQKAAEYDSLQEAFNECTEKLRVLESEQGALLKLSQDRWKEITQYKDITAKLQAEMKTIRQESANLATTREELASLQKELRALEKREKDARKEITTISRLASDRESEIKQLNERLTAEKTLRTKLEDEKRKLTATCQRLEGEKNEKSAEVEKTVRRLEARQSELSNLRPKMKSLEDKVSKLQKENNLAKEDVDLKTQQYNNAQGLLASMRDQTTELSTRLKEAQSQAESLEEEVTEAQKHLAERTREAETMRRMLAEVNERADGKIRELTSRMEAAIEERDRIEDESSTIARRKSRENEELKDRVRELEREVKALTNEKAEFEVRERGYVRQRMVLDQMEMKAISETEDMRTTVTSLRSALNASERQVREAEKQKADMKKLLDEARSRYEKINKELKSLQPKVPVSSGPSVANNGARPSMDSTRSGSNNGTAARGGVDAAYLKNIFLQFIEVKDERLRIQLVPVLSTLLGFDKNDEEKWLQAIHRMTKSTK